MGIYELSVGRGSNLLLNIGPDRRGRLPEADVARLSEFAAEIERRYSAPVPAELIFDEGGVDIVFPEHLDVNCAVLEENISLGQSVSDFELNYFSFDGTVNNKTVLFRGSTVGKKLIVSFPSVRVCRLRLDVLASDGDWKLNSVKVFKY